MHTSPQTAARMRVVDTHPVIAGREVGIVAVTEVAVGTPERQRALVEASTAAWATLPWPETLVAITWLLSLDGQQALAYVQWADDSEFEAFSRTYRPVLAEHFRAAVPGLAPPPPAFYRLQRSGVRPDAPVPGCIVIVSVEFDGPDAGRQRAWIDAVFAALDAEPAPPAGGISGHFHASLDGTRVLNYAEWIDEAAHREALARAGQGSIGSGPAWRRVHTFPGLKASRVARYRFDRRLVGPRA